MRAIDADKLKATIRPVNEYDDYCSALISDVKKIFHKQIDDAPTITYEDLIPHGRWIKRFIDGWDMFVCSNCSGWPHSAAHMHKTFKYCPNCGAKMKGGKAVSKAIDDLSAMHYKEIRVIVDKILDLRKDKKGGE